MTRSRSLNNIKSNRKDTPITTSRINERPQKTLRVGIVGCGRVATHHLRFISQLPQVSVTGLVDNDESSARRLGAAYNVQTVYDSLEMLLEKETPDVIHILTPPFLHYSQARVALERGVHVFIEKPVTLQAEETEDLYRLAATKGGSLCPDFIQLFHPAFLQARSLIESGELGRLVYVESQLAQTLDMPELKEARGLHWSYQLPGGVLHNYITHPLYLALYFVGTPRDIKVSPRSLGALPQGLTDHLDVHLEGERISAHVVLSHTMNSQPSYFVNLFCEKGVVWVNFDTSTMLVTRSSWLPRSVDRATSNFRQAAQLSSSAVRNIYDFLRGKLVPYQGLQTLIPQFYASVREGSTPPISSELALTVARAEEEVLGRAGRLHLDLSPRSSRQLQSNRSERVLVTGAAGYVGQQVVQRLVEQRYAVRALVRPLSRIELLERLGVEIVFGDVRDLENLSDAMDGINVVIHAAATLRGTTEAILEGCATATQNVAEAARKAKVNRVIYMSSMSVYDFLKVQDGEIIDERSPLERHPESRGAYSWGKRKAEDIALGHLQDASPSWTILRPSVVVGGGGDVLAPAGSRLGNFLICLGSRRKTLRLIHVEDVATALVRLLESKATRGGVYTLSSPESLLLRNYVDVCVRASRYRKVRVVYIPFWFARAGVFMLTVLRKISKRGPSMNVQRLMYLFRDLTVSVRALKESTGWEPPTGLLERLKGEIAAEQLPSAVPIGKTGTSQASREFGTIRR
jgi:predicted dehydrogenase/nucleoside-diphosphate-sugar epimerase